MPIVSWGHMQKLRARQRTEHEAIVRALLARLAGRCSAMVVYPHETERAWDAAAPDLVLTNPSSRRVVRQLAIETRSSLAHPDADRWHALARHAPLTLVVPKGSARVVERLLGTDARIVEYERRGDGEVVFRPAI